MAKVGGGAAYKQLEVPKDGISPALQYWGGKEAQRLADKKLADEREGVRKQKEQEDYFKGLPDPNIEAVMTNQESLDHVNTNFATQNTAMSVQDVMKAKEYYQVGDLKNADKHKAIAQKRIRAFKEYNGLLEQIKPLLGDYHKNIDTYNPNDKRRMNFYDGVSKNNVIPFTDKDGRLRALVGVDIDGDGKLSEEEKQRADDYIREGAEKTGLKFEEISLHDFANQFYQPFKKVDITEEDGLLDKLASSVGIVTKDEQKGYMVNTLSGFDDSKYEHLKNLVKSELKDPETLAWVMNTMPDGITDIVEGFKPEDIDRAVEFITDQTISKYPTESSQKFLSSKYSTDSRAALAKAKKEDEDPLSNLHFDAVRFTEGDYTGLLGRHETDFGEEVNIREVVPAPEGDYVIAITDSGDRIEVPKTKRGFLEFKIRGKAEYKGLTPEKVMQTDPVAYREGNVEGAPIVNIANDLFDEEGKPTVDDEEFLKRLNETFGIQGEDIFTGGGNSLTINGKFVDTSTKEKFVNTMNNALNKKEKINW